MVKEITTASGFTCEIDEAAMNDMELLEALRDIDNGNPTRFSDVLTMLIGDQKKALYDFVRNEAGRVPVDAVSDILKEIFSAYSSLKK